MEALSVEFDVQMIQKRIPDSFWKRVNVQMVVAPHDGEAANPCQSSMGGEPKVRRSIQKILEDAKVAIKVKADKAFRDTIFSCRQDRL